jgi:hypothetical protein
MGTLIQFIPKQLNYTVEMWPADWKSEYNPTLYELTTTLNTIESYRNILINELASAGVQSEFDIREGLAQLDCMHSALMNYYRAD